MSDSVSGVGASGTQRTHHTAAQRQEYQAAKSDEVTDPAFQAYAQANAGQGIPLSTLYENFQAQQADGAGQAQPGAVTLASADPTAAAAGVAAGTLGALTPTLQTPQATA